jgi:hypothetical protein
MGRVYIQLAPFNASARAPLTLKPVAEEPITEHPGVEVERVPVLGPEEVRGSGVLQVGRPPQWVVAMGRHTQRVVVVHRLRENELRVRVQGPALRRLVPVHEGLRGGAVVRVAEGRGADGLLRGRGALLGHQGLDGEAAFSRR